MARRRYEGRGRMVEEANQPEGALEGGN